MNRPITAVLSFAGPIACALLSCGLTGCNSGDARAHANLEPPQEPYHSGWIRMGHWGIGPIRPLTYFERPAIKALFPTSKVRDVTLRISDDETAAGITVTQNGIPLLEIDDGGGNAPGTDDPLIGQVRAIGGPVVGPDGERLSMSWTDAKFDLSQCEIGVDRDRNSVICARRGEGAITYIFAVPSWDSEEVPPEPLMRQVAFLKEIVWTPPPLPRALGRGVRHISRSAHALTVLAIDTCLDACSVAVCDQDRVLAVLTQSMSRGHQERLAPMTAEAMQAAGVGFDALSRIAVTVGPGSFTGLRVGLAFAKGLALATGAPCIGVGVLEALAASEPAKGFVCAAVDAKRGQIYLQIFIDGRPAMAPDALSPEAAAARLAELWTGGPATLIGSGARLLEGVIAGAAVIDRAAPDPLAIARLGAAARAPFPPPRPLYLRAPDAKIAQPKPVRL